MSGSDGTITPRRAAAMSDGEMREKGVELNDRLDRLLNRKSSLGTRSSRGSVDISARAKEVEEGLTSALERLRQEKLKGIQVKIDACIESEETGRVHIEEDENRARAHFVDTTAKLVEAEVKRRAAEEEEAEVLRLAQEEAEAERRALEEAEAERRAEEEAEAKRRAEEEAEAKRRAEEEAEAKRRAEEEAEAKRRAEEEAEAKQRAAAAAGGEEARASRSLGLPTEATQPQREVANDEDSSSEDECGEVRPGRAQDTHRRRRRRRPIDFTAPFVEKEHEPHPMLSRPRLPQRSAQRDAEVSSTGALSKTTLVFLAVLGAFIAVGIWAARS